MSYSLAIQCSSFRALIGEEHDYLSLVLGVGPFEKMASMR